jgi:hypothetical protein
VKIAHGRDAVDVALSTAYGAATLKSMVVWSDEIHDDDAVTGAPPGETILGDPALASGTDVQYPGTSEMPPSPSEAGGLGRGSGVGVPRATPLMSAGVRPSTQSADHHGADTDADAVPAQARG